MKVLLALFCSLVFSFSSFSFTKIISPYLTQYDTDGTTLWIAKATDLTMEDNEPYFLNNPHFTWTKNQKLLLIQAQKGLVYPAPNKAGEVDAIKFYDDVKGLYRIHLTGSEGEWRLETEQTYFLPKKNEIGSEKYVKFFSIEEEITSIGFQFNALHNELKFLKNVHSTAKSIKGF